MELTVVLVIVVALGFDFLNGVHDASNSIATVVATRVLSPRQAVMWAAFFNFAAFLVLLGGVSDGAFPVSGPISAIVASAVVGVVMLVVYLGALAILRSRDLETGVAPLLNRVAGRSRADS